MDKRVTRMVSLSMAWITVGLFWQGVKLDIASLEDFQFWTGIAWNYLVNQINSNGANFLDLRVWLEVLEVGLLAEFLEQRKIGL